VCIEQELSYPDNNRPTRQDACKDAHKDSHKGPLSSTETRAKLLSTVDIRTISANGVRLGMRQPDTKVFSIILDRLDRMIEDKQQEQLPPRRPPLLS
jgi:hypothetical protein